MTLGNKKFREFTISHDSDSPFETQIIKLPEGGAMGYYDIYCRRINGSDGTRLLIQKGFGENMEYAVVEFDTDWWGGWWNPIQDNIERAGWSNYNDAPYISVTVFYGSSDSTDIEFYVTAF